MSSVTSIVLIMSCCELDGSKGESGPPALVEKVNEWSKMLNGRDMPLAQVEQYFGGFKHPQTYVYGAGFNHFMEQQFAGFVLELPWKHPDEVVLVMHPEDGAAMVYRPSELNESALEAIAEFKEYVADYGLIPPV